MCKHCGALADDCGLCPECLVAHKAGWRNSPYGKAERIAPYTTQLLWQQWFDNQISGDELDADIYAIIS